MSENFLHSDITSKIIKAFYNVYNKLGFGFLEKVYHNSLLIELSKYGLSCGSKIPIEVFYDQFIVGLYIADIVVNESVIIEIKVAENIGFVYIPDGITKVDAVSGIGLQAVS